METILKSKWYLIRFSKENEDSVELVGGPFDGKKEAEPHLMKPEASDLDVVSGSALILSKTRLQDKRPEKRE